MYVNVVFKGNCHARSARVAPDTGFLLCSWLISLVQKTQIPAWGGRKEFKTKNSRCSTLKPALGVEAGRTPRTALLGRTPVAEEQRRRGRAPEAELGRLQS